MGYANTEKLQELRDEAVLAIESSQWSTARTKLLAAQTIIETTPDFELGGQQVQWRSSIENLLRRVNRLLAVGSGSTAGPRRSKIRYKALEG